MNSTTLSKVRLAKVGTYGRLDMRVATFGYQTWGHKTLEALIKSDHDVVLAVTHPPSDQVYESIWADSVEELARDHGIPVHLAQRPDAELMERVKQAEPDII